MNPNNHYFAQKVALLLLILCSIIAHANPKTAQNDTWANTNPIEPVDANHLSLQHSHLKCSALLTFLGQYKHLNLTIEAKPQTFVEVMWPHITWEKAWHQALRICHYQWQNSAAVHHLKPIATRKLYTLNLKHQILIPHTKLWQQLTQHLTTPSRLTLSPDGTVLWLWGRTIEAENLKQILRDIDYPKPQIFVDATWVVLDQHAQQLLGLNQSQQALFNPAKLFEMIKKTSAAHLGHPLGTWALNQALKVLMMEMAKKGHAKLIASPRILTENGQQASFKTGVLYPYYSKNNRGSQQLQFKPIELTLELTPKLLADGWLSLNVHSEQNQLQAATTTLPIINTHIIDTHIHIHPQQTLILGGANSDQNVVSRSEQTVLGQIPLINLLTNQNHSQQQHQRLFVIITPTVVYNHHPSFAPSNTSPK